MKPLTAALLKQIFPAAPDTIAELIPHLEAAFCQYKINTPQRVAAFLARAAVETGQFKTFEENLNYSADRLRAVWPKRFPTQSFAMQYHRQPEKIANFVYANRLGNGDEASGDGWRCRGRGIFQTTARANYEEAGLKLTGDKNYFIAHPEELARPKYAALSAGLFWDTRKLNALADAGSIAAISKKINGGEHGLQETIAFYNKAKQLLA